MSFSASLSLSGSRPSTVADLVSLLKGGGTVSGRKFVSGDYLAVTTAREIRVLRDSAQWLDKPGSLPKMLA